jgi:hypothetical protein
MEGGHLPSNEAACSRKIQRNYGDERSDPVSGVSDESNSPRVARIPDFSHPDELVAIRKENTSLKAQVNSLKAEIYDAVQKRPSKELEKLKSVHDRKVAHIKQRYKQHIQELKRGHAKESGSFRRETDTGLSISALQDDPPNVREHLLEARGENTCAQQRVLAAQEKIAQVEGERDAATAHVVAAAAANRQTQEELSVQKSLVAALQQQVASAVAETDVLRKEYAAADSSLRTSEKLRADLQAKDAIVTEMRNTIRDSIIDMGELKRKLATAVVEKQAGVTVAEHSGVKRLLMLSDERVRALEEEIARLKLDHVTGTVTTEEHSEAKRRLADRVQQQDGEITLLRTEMQTLSVAGHATNVRIQELYAWAQKEAQQVQDKQQQVTQLKLQVDVLHCEKQDLQGENQDLATKVRAFRDKLESSSTELAKQKESGSAVAAGLRATVLHLQRQLTLLQKEQRMPLPPPPPPQPPTFLQQSVPLPPLLPVISMWPTGGATALPPQQLGSGGNLHTQCVAEELQGKLSWAMHAFQQKQAELAQVRIQLTWAQEAFTKLYNNAAHETCEIHRQQATDIVRRRNIINVTRLAQLEARVAVVDVALVATAGDTAQKSWRESAERRLSEYLFARETEWSAQLADLQAQLWEAQTTSLVVVRQLQTEKELSARTAQCAAEQTQQLRRLQLAANQVLGRMQESHPAECEQLLQEMRWLQPHATSTELDIYAVLSLLGRLESRDVERHTRIAAGAVVLGAASPAQTTPRHQAPPAVLDLTADSDSDC